MPCVDCAGLMDKPFFTLVTILELAHSTIYAVVDGLIGGAIFGWLYNRFAARLA
jgi:hypothetical protein